MHSSVVDGHKAANSPASQVADSLLQRAITIPVIVLFSLIYYNSFFPLLLYFVCIFIHLSNYHIFVVK